MRYATPFPANKTICSLQDKPLHHRSLLFTFPTLLHYDSFPPTSPSIVLDIQAEYSQEISMQLLIFVFSLTILK